MNTRLSIPRKLFIYTIGVGLGFIFLFPFLWQLSTSLKAPDEVLRLPITWIPRKLVFANYTEAWAATTFNRFLVNTLLVTLLNLAGHIGTGSFIAYGFAKLRFPGRDFLFMLVLATMMIPFHVKAVPLYLLFQKLGWLDTLKPLIIPAFFGGDAMTLFLFKQFFLTIPDVLDEASEIDGCSPLRTFWNIILPLSRPVIATVSIFTFMASWNNLWEPLIFLTSREKFTIALGLRFFISESDTSYNLLMAASIIAVFPCLAVFFAFQRHFVSGVATAGVKG